MPNADGQPKAMLEMPKRSWGERLLNHFGYHRAEQLRHLESAWDETVGLACLVAHMDPAMPLRYKRAICDALAVVAPSHHRLHLLREDVRSKDIDLLPPHQQQQIREWLQKHPHYLLVLVTALAAGADENTAWGLAYR